MLICQIFILSLLFLIFIQDLESRSVYWFIFPVLTLLFVLYHFNRHRPYPEIAQAIFINLVFLSIQFLMASFYFFLKHKNWINLTDDLLGWGDISFLISITFYLSALNFLVFYIGSLVLVLAIWIVWQGIAKKKSKQIPLAGVQAMIFAVLLTFDWWVKTLDLTSDTWLLSLITG